MIKIQVVVLTGLIMTGTLTQAQETSVSASAFAPAQPQTTMPLAGAQPSTNAQTLGELPSGESVSSWPTGRKMIALTFDDGPNPKITPRMVQLLEEKGAKGTFFVTGPAITAYKQTAQDWLTRPSVEIGNHTWTHPQLNKLPADRVASELTRTANAVKEVTGKQITLMRPPFGATNAATNAQIKTLGYTPVLWSVDTNDWRKRTSDQMIPQVLAEARDGAIVLMHDRYEADLITVAAVIDQLKAQGYQFVTVSEMMSAPRLRHKTAAAAPAVKNTAKTPAKRPNVREKTTVTHGSTPATGAAKPSPKNAGKPVIHDETKKTISNTTSPASSNIPVSTPVPTPQPDTKRRFFPKIFGKSAKIQN